MNAAKYRFVHGSRIIVALRFEASDDETVDDIELSAWLRFTGFKAGEATPDMPAPIPLAVETRDDVPGWFLIIEADADDYPPPGFHLLGIKAGDDLSDRYAEVEIIEPVGGA